MAVRRCDGCGWIDFDDLKAQADAAYQRGLAKGVESVAIQALTDEPSGEAAQRWREIFEEGIAEGCKTAHQDLSREWGVALTGPAEGEIWPADDEREAREYGGRTVSRLVGEWETVEAPEEAKSPRD
jgi:hypothetical protein